ncbi:MAG: aromatic ring-hydroxylating oxygenase subunit alpha [Hyphomicrobiaceae bacterium]
MTEGLIKSRRPGWSLEQPFYVDPTIFALDMERVFRTGWLFAGHACEIREPGDFFSYDVAGDSLIVIRQDDGSVRALFNVCRHRGSRICRKPSGHARRLVCPYHQWTYDKDGRLLHNNWMPDNFDKSDFGLEHAHVQVVAGLIFVTMANEPPHFEPADDLTRLLNLQGIENARVAYTETYDIAANWKLVIENQRECYHCSAKHMDYARIQLDTDLHDPDKQTAIAARIDESRSHWKALGLDVTMVRSDSNFNGSWWRTNRAPFREGCFSETMDGHTVAPLMGGYRDPDVGNGRANTYPNFWLHASCDHVHTMRVTPIDALTTRISASWLVKGDAIEERDYRVEDLIAFSKLVNDEDYEIVSDHAKGVASPRYQPGPYSCIKEQAVEHFVAWYIDRMSVER